MNDERKTPSDLAKDDPPMFALLNGTKSRSITSATDDNILDAAKDLLSTTLDPVSAAEEKVMLTCQKVIDEAHNLERPPLNQYKKCKECLIQHSVINNQFKQAFESISKYKDQVGVNCQNVANMCNTLEENEKAMRERMQASRTTNCSTQESHRTVSDQLSQKQAEFETVSAELLKYQKLVEEFTAKKNSLQAEVEQLTKAQQELSNTNQDETDNETRLTMHQESLQNTRQLIDKGVTSLKNLDSSTTDRMLSTGLEYLDFLRKYNQYVKSILDTMDGRIKTMHDRIDMNTSNIDEIPILELNMDKTKIEGVVKEYESNVDKYNRRRQKIVAIQESIKQDYQKLKDIISKFGRELDPLEV